MTGRGRFTHAGQELVEFAITIPIFILLIMGIFDLGRGVYYYTLIHNAAREGARHGIVFPDDSAGIISQARRILSGLDPTDVNVWVDCNDGATCPDHIVVRVTYTFTPVTPLIGRLFGPEGEVLLTSTSQMRLEY